MAQWAGGKRTSRTDGQIRWVREWVGMWHARCEGMNGLGACMSTNGSGGVVLSFFPFFLEFQAQGEGERLHGECMAVNRWAQMDQVGILILNFFVPCLTVGLGACSPVGWMQVDWLLVGCSKGEQDMAMQACAFGCALGCERVVV